MQVNSVNNNGINLGAGSAGSSTGWPMPNMPGGSGFDSSIPSDQAYNAFFQDGYMDKLKDALAKMYATQDPSVIQGVMAYITNLLSGADPNINKSLVTSYLNKNLNSQEMTQFAGLQGMESAFFFGYNGQTGQAGAQAYITAMLGVLTPLKGQDPFIDNQIDNLNALEGPMLAQFTKEHTQGSNLIWSFGGVTYTLNPNGSATDPSSDNFYIWSIIKGEGPQGTPNPFFSQLNVNQFEHDWRVSALQQLLMAFKDPMMALSMFLTGGYDSMYQSNETALGNTTNALTLMTNSFATPLLQDVQKIGSMTDQDSQSFVNNLMNFGVFTSVSTNTTSIAANIQSQIQSIMGTELTDPHDSSGKTQITLGNLLNGISSGTYKVSDLTTALNDLNPQTGGHSTSAGSTSPGLLAITNTVQAMGDLVTQTGKTTSTLLTQNSDLDNAVLKFGGSAADPKSGIGPVALMAAIESNITSSRSVG